MHWLDIDPPAYSSTGLAGLSAHGHYGTTATFDGIFTPAFLTAMGFTDFSQVQGYVDLTPVVDWTGSALTVPGVGDGSLWPAGSWKYRITNSNWCTHDILFGHLTSPVQATAVSPKGSISTTRPTFRWKKMRLAAGYEVRIYKGSKLLLKRTASVNSWRATKALPRGAKLAWKVRAVNAAGAGSLQPRAQVQDPLTEAEGRAVPARPSADRPPAPERTSTTHPHRHSGGACAGPALLDRPRPGGIVTLVSPARPAHDRCMTAAVRGIYQWYISQGCDMTQTAKLFMNGRSQAVRLPAEFRFPGREVLIERHGDAVMLRPKPEGWDDFFARPSQVPEDFLAERKDGPPEDRELF